MSGMHVIPAQVSPVQEVREPLGAVPLDDPLAPVLLAEAVQELGQLVARLVWRAEPPVHDVDPIGCWVSNMFLHETAKSREVCGYTGNAHHSTLSWSVAPGLIVRWEYTKVAASNKLLIVQGQQGAC